MMSGGYIGSKISLISRSDIRYVGILHSINSADSTVALEQVRSYGTEGRKGNPADEIAPSDNVFDYIVFRGSDVKDLHVCEAPTPTPSLAPQVPNDPAILGTTAPRPSNYQGFGPPQPNFPGAQLNPYYLHAAALQQQHYWQQQQPPPQQPQQPQQQVHQSSQLNIGENAAREVEQSKSQLQKEHAGPDKNEDNKVENQVSGNKNISSKSGSASRSAIGHVTNIRNDNIKELTSSAAAVEKLAKRVSELHVSETNASSSHTATTNERHTNFHHGHHNHNRPNNNRLPGMGGHLLQQPRRSRSGRRNYGSNYDRNRVTVPTSDFDFESSNAKFNKEEIVKEVVKKSHVNHDGKDGKDTKDVKEDEVAHVEEEDEDEVVIPPAESFYDRKKSFFDNISCETKERMEQQGPDGRRGLSVAERRQKQSEERRLNLETFGQVSIDGGRYRGGHRGRGYRGRGYRSRGSGGGGGFRGGYSSNYRGNNFRH